MNSVRTSLTMFSSMFSSMFSTANPVAGIVHMFGHSFLRRAFLAGTAISLASGLVGYFVVLRRQVFTGEALSHVAFTGALGALAVGAELRVGLYGSCIVFGLLMAALGSRGRADDAVVGSVFAWVLGLGALFLTIYTRSSSASDGTAGVRVLFGSIFGLSRGQTTASVVVSIGVATLILAISRPLLFASIDEAVAGSSGVPVRLLGFGFLGVVGVTAAVATQAVGALLLLGLLAAPAGAAQRLTSRPFTAMWLAAGIAVGSMWAGLSLSYAAPKVPPSFGIVAVASACYLVAIAITTGRRAASFGTPGHDHPDDRPHAHSHSH